MSVILPPHPPAPAGGAAHHHHGGGAGNLQLLRSYSTPLSAGTAIATADVYGGGGRTPPPPLTPKRSGKMIGIRIVLLDESVTFIQAQV